MSPVLQTIEIVASYEATKFAEANKCHISHVVCDTEPWDAKTSIHSHLECGNSSPLSFLASSAANDPSEGQKRKRR